MIYAKLEVDMSAITKIKFKYRFDEAYNPVYINGVQGGVTPREMFVMNFYQERQPLPKTVTYDIDNGKLKHVIDSTPVEEDDTVSVVRFVETGITFSLDTAIELRDWLDMQIKNFTEKDEDNEDLYDEAAEQL